MKSSLLILVLSFSTFQALSQVNKPCFTVPQTVSINELDSISIANDCMITSFSFQLFNRWGELLRESNKMTNPLIFSTNEPELNKTKKKKKKKNSAATLDKPMAQGVYFFIITYTLPGSNEQQKHSGNITFY
jgi:hypothetical protein